MVLGFVSDSMSRVDLGDVVAASVVDPLSRVEGVGDVTLFGSQYAMRIWLDKVLGTAWGSSYVNDFIDRGRVKKVSHLRSALPQGRRYLPQCAHFPARAVRRAARPDHGAPVDIRQPGDPVQGAGRRLATGERGAGIKGGCRIR